MLGALARAARQGKGGFQPGDEEVQQSLFADGTIPYTETLVTPQEKVLEKVNTYSRVEGYKTSVRESVAFLRTN